MGFCNLDGRQIGDDGRNAHGRDDIPVTVRQPVDMSDIYESINHQMRQSAVRLMVLSRKSRVRKWIAKPWLLDVLHDGLSHDVDGLPDDRALIAYAEHLLERTSVPTARVGFGGESSRLTAQALMLYGRAVRRMRVAQQPMLEAAE